MFFGNLTLWHCMETWFHVVSRFASFSHYFTFHVISRFTWFHFSQDFTWFYVSCDFTFRVMSRDFTWFHVISRNFTFVFHTDIFHHTIILQTLRFYVKSHFGEFKRSKNVIFGNFRVSELWNLVNLELKNCSNLLKITIQSL